ncbi:uncharacterized protein LOC131614184 [Vicia villosa]|uniref:uncharacterized protein LOC131614184 n=1 Tax=Vicia villosa TaxID=3911 RepID=UPI00273BE933|nr:uncharacterized protein LOC131614184 [Vicia villosa]
MSMLPWCIIGDFNDLLSQNDMQGVNAHPNWLCTGFQDAVGDCDLTNIPLEGYPFTWTKSRGTPHMIEERLDRSLITSEWLRLFPSAKLLNLIASHSNHTPILLCCDPVPIYCAVDLERWSRMRVRRQNEERDSICVTMELYRGSNDPTSASLYMEAHNEYNKILIRDDTYWRQRAKMHWLQDGD